MVNAKVSTDWSEGGLERAEEQVQAPNTEP
jgi:hypothetical protein